MHQNYLSNYAAIANESGKYYYEINYESNRYYVLIQNYSFNLVPFKFSITYEPLISLNVSMVFMKDENVTDLSLSQV